MNHLVSDSEGWVLIQAFSDVWYVHVAAASVLGARSWGVARVIGSYTCIT